MKGIVLYQSKHGSTRQYAEWISEETGYPEYDIKKDKLPVLDDVDLVIIGSWILNGRMVAHSWIKKNWKKLEKKDLMIFSVSADLPTEELKTKYIDSSLPDEAKGKVDFYSLHGRFRREDQNFLLKCMLNFAAKFENEGDLAANMVIGVDGVRKENLSLMLEKIDSISK
jgi:menaquinone-dependent protoporphyrinogen IX oxidase